MLSWLERLDTTYRKKSTVPKKKKIRQSAFHSGYRFLYFECCIQHPWMLFWLRLNVRSDMTRFTLSTVLNIKISHFVTKHTMFTSCLIDGWMCANFRLYYLRFFGMSHAFCRKQQRYVTSIGPRSRYVVYFGNILWDDHYLTRVYSEGVGWDCFDDILEVS